MKQRLLIVLAIFFVGVSYRVEAQDFAVKTNLLYDATATVNAGIEFGLAPRWTMDISGNYNGWQINDGKWKHALIQPEVRYWFCDRFSRHFIGFHAIGSIYNVGGIKNNISFLGTDFSKLSEERYQGYGIGAGVAYGYAFILGKHWNLELEVGVGYTYLNYDRYQCTGCGRKVGSGDHHYVGLTKAAVNLVYLF